MVSTSDVRIQTSRIRIRQPRIPVHMNPNPPYFSWIRIRIRLLWIRIRIWIQHNHRDVIDEQKMRIHNFFLESDSAFLSMNPNPNPAQNTLNPDSDSHQLFQHFYLRVGDKGCDSSIMYYRNMGPFETLPYTHVNIHLANYITPRLFNLIFWKLGRNFFWPV